MVANYCSAVNGDTSGTGLVGAMGDMSPLPCENVTNNYSSGALNYQCTMNNVTGGIWQIVSNTCNGAGKFL